MGLNIKRIQLGEKPGSITYTTVPKDYDGWVDASLYLPQDYDLILMRVDRKSYKCTFPGWWNGGSFDGAEYRDGDIVKLWKRIIDK